MDTETANKVVDQADQQIALIRARMPKTYAAIKAKGVEIGDGAYRLVRRGARGELKCFYACENDIKVGTYWHVDLSTDVATLVERYGMTFVCMWGESASVPRVPEDPSAAHVQREEVAGVPVTRRNAEFRAFIDGVHAEDSARGGPRMNGNEVPDGSH